MPRPRRISAYPSYLLDLASRLNSEDLELSFPSRREAEAARLTLYGLKGAIRSEGMETVYIGLNCCRISIQKRENDYLLLLQQPENAFFYQSIETALSRLPPPLSAGPEPLSSLALAGPEHLPPPKKDNLLAYLGLEEDEPPPPNSPIEF